MTVFNESSELNGSTIEGTSNYVRNKSTKMDLPSAAKGTLKKLRRISRSFDKTFSHKPEEEKKDIAPTSTSPIPSEPTTDLKITSSPPQFKISPVIQGNALKAFIIKPVSEFSNVSKQFVDILDMASGEPTCGEYSFLQDRIGSLMRYASRKSFKTKQNAMVSSREVKKMVKSVEEKKEEEKQAPDLVKRGKYVPKKSAAEVTSKKPPIPKSKSTKKIKSASSNKTFTEKLKSKINFLSRDKEDKVHSESEIKEERDSDDKECVSINDNKITKEIHDLPPIIKSDGETESQELESQMDEPQSECTLDDEDEFPLSFDEPIYDTDGNQFLLESCIEVEEDENIVDYVQEVVNTKEDNTVESSLSVASINEVLSGQFEDNSKDSETGNQYFLEEECVALSPYTDEAKLYRLLFPGKKLPICNETVHEFDEYLTETVSELPQKELPTESCEMKVHKRKKLNLITVMDEILILECPIKQPIYNDDKAHEFDSIQLDEQHCVEIITRDETNESAKIVVVVLLDGPSPPPKERTPPPKEPTPPPKEPTPLPKEPTPPPKEPTPPPKEPTPPPKEPTPPPAKPVKARRKPPPKKKKVYDRNFLKAVQLNQCDEVRRLLYNGADPDTTCSIGTVLHQATQLGFTSIVQELLWGGSETEMRNELGDTALHIAAIGGHTEIAFLLTSSGSDVDAQNNYNITPLHMALSYGQLGVIHILVRMNADIHIPDKIGDSPLTLAKRMKYPEETLDPIEAEKGPITTLPPELSLVLAVEVGSAEQVRSALSNKASPNTLVPLALHWPGNSTVLHRAAHLGFENVVRDLLQAGSNSNAKDMVGNTPLHTAVQGGQDEVVKILVKNGANVDAVTQSGVSPLHRAAARGREMTMMILLKHGADAELRDNQNKTPLDWARQKGYMVLARNISKIIG